MPKVMVFTTQRCSFCKAAKELLKKRGISYDETVLDDNDEASWSALTARSGMQTVPQIFYGDKLVGGFQQLAELDTKDQLSSLMRKS